MGDWDDLRFFLSVAEHGSTLAAGSALRTSQSTVFRRIAALEAALGVLLFERRPSGYVLTATGSTLLPVAKQIETGITRFAETAADAIAQTIGVVRLSAPDSALEYMLPTVMAGFRRRFPNVRIEIVVSNRQLDLATGEADVAVRANPASDQALFGRRLGEDRPVIAGSRLYAEQHPLPRSDAEVADHDFINLTGVLPVLLADWFTRVVPKSRILLQPDSMASAVTAMRSGLGISVLPQFVVDRDPDLVAAPLQLPLKPIELWVLTHERLRGSPPARALIDLIAEYVASTTPPRLIAQPERMHSRSRRRSPAAPSTPTYRSGASDARGLLAAADAQP